MIFNKLSSQKAPWVIDGQSPVLFRRAIRYPRLGASYLSFLFIGADLFAVKVGDFTIRAVALPLLAAFILDLRHSLDTIRVDLALCLLFGLLVFSALLSLPTSYDPLRTVAYLCWAIFIFFVVFPVFFNIARSRSAWETVQIWFWFFRLQAVLLVLEALARLVGSKFGLTEDIRAHLLFYEPSYAALFFGGYIGASMFLVSNGISGFRRDLIISMMALVALGSATAVYALIFSIALCVLLSRNRIQVLVLAVAGSALLSTVLTVFFRDTNLYYMVLGYLFDSDDGPLNSIFGRSGNRIVRLLWGWDAFLHHPFFGIGFGADSTYTATVQPPEIVDPYERSYLQTPGTPFVNPFIEAGATMGFFGLASLIMIVIVFVARFIGIKKKHCQEALFVRSIFVGFFVMFLTLQAEATFLRFYVWSTFGLACGAALRWRTLNVRKSIFDQQEVHLE